MSDQKTQEVVTQEEVNDAEEMLGKGYDQYVKDESPHDFFHQIPNLVDDYGLSPQAYRLYGHFRRVAGERGKCWQNTRTLAQECEMSLGAISNAKKELTETQFIPFIRITKVPTKSGFSYDEVTLTDLWQLNHDVYSNGPVHNMNSSEYERLVHNMKQRIFNSKNIKRPGEKTPKEKNVFTYYEQEIGLLTPFIADSIKDWLQSVPEKWLTDAMREAAEANKRNWNYCQGILKRWKAQGNQEPMKQKGNGYKSQGSGGGNGRLPTSVPEVKDIPMLDPEKVREAKERFHAGLQGK